jgi:hypothetical protein
VRGSVREDDIDIDVLRRGRSTMPRQVLSCSASDAPRTPPRTRSHARTCTPRTRTRPRKPRTPAAPHPGLLAMSPPCALRRLLPRQLRGCRLSVWCDFSHLGRGSVSTVIREKREMVRTRLPWLVGDEVIGKIRYRYIRRGRARSVVRQLDLMCGLGLGHGLKHCTSGGGIIYYCGAAAGAGSAAAGATDELAPVTSVMRLMRDRTSILVRGLSALVKRWC